MSAKSRSRTTLFSVCMRVALEQGYVRLTKSKVSLAQPSNRVLDVFLHVSLISTQWLFSNATLSNTPCSPAPALVLSPGRCWAGYETMFLAPSLSRGGAGLGTRLPLPCSTYHTVLPKTLGLRRVIWAGVGVLVD